MGILDVNLHNGDSLPIRQLRLDDMVKNASIVMIAKRGGGKSWVVKSILMHFNDIPCGIIISPTDKMNSFYNNFFPDTYIHYEYKTDIINKILEHQEIMIDKKQLRQQQGRDLDCRSFIIMDDCLSQRGTWLKDKPILDLLFNGRHYELMYILTMQAPLGIGPELRTNFDYIFLLQQEFISEQKKVYDHYAGMFPSFNAFRQVFTTLTSDYGCMVIDNRRKTKTSLERIFWYRAPDLSNATCKFGCRQFRQFHENNYNPNWKKDSRLKRGLNPMAFIKKQNIHVDLQEVDDNGRVVDKRKMSTLNFNKLNKQRYNNFTQYA